MPASNVRDSLNTEMLDGGSRTLAIPALGKEQKTERLQVQGCPQVPG